MKNGAAINFTFVWLSNQPHRNSEKCVIKSASNWANMHFFRFFFFIASIPFIYCFFCFLLFLCVCANFIPRNTIEMKMKILRSTLARIRALWRETERERKISSQIKLKKEYWVKWGKKEFILNNWHGWKERVNSFSVRIFIWFSLWFICWFYFRVIEQSVCIQLVFGTCFRSHKFFLTQQMPGVFCCAKKNMIWYVAQKMFMVQNRIEFHWADCAFSNSNQFVLLPISSFSLCWFKTFRNVNEKSLRVHSGH